MGEQYSKWLEDRFKNGKLPSHQQLSIPMEVKKEGKVATVPEALAIVNNALMCSHGHSQFKAEVNELVVQEDNQSTKEYSDSNGDSDSLLNDLDTVLNNTMNDIAEDVDFNPVLKNAMKEMAEAVDFELAHSVSVFPKEEQLTDRSKTHECVEMSSSDESEDECEILQCHEMVPPSDDEACISWEQYRSEIKIEALWEKAHQCVSAATSAVVNAAQGSAPTTSTTEMSNVIEIKDKLLLECPVCEYSNKSQKKCVSHITDTHPEYRFKCGMCSQDFTSFHTKYRHEKEYNPPMIFCNVCGKGYYFQSELNKHAGVHSEVLLYPCNQCDKHFTQAKSLSRHQELHSNKTVVCSVCEKVWELRDRHYSHYHGIHGKGYTVKCGKHYQWPASHARHKESCDQCIEIIAKEQAEKESHKRFKTVHSTGAKKLKTEHCDDSLVETKKRVQHKIQNILELKKDL